MLGVLHIVTWDLLNIKKGLPFGYKGPRMEKIEVMTSEQVYPVL